MASLIYNPETKRILDKLTLNLPHALMLDGPVGVGLATIAKDIAWRELAGIVQSTNAKGETDTSSSGVIRIDQIRRLIAQTRGKSTTKQVYIIDEVDKMHHAAQNAFLKLLEEPNDHVHFILTTHSPQTLLPTILSRVQRVHIRPVDTAQSRQFIESKQVSDPRKVNQLLFLADGRPAELSRLIDNEARFAQESTYITDARLLLQGAPRQRAAVALRYTERAAALKLLSASQQIVARSISQNVSGELIKTAEHLADTYDNIAASGNVRLQLINLVLQ